MTNTRLSTMVIFLVLICCTQSSIAEDTLEIKFGETEYHQGQEASITLHFNSDIGRSVNEFYVNVYYGSSGVDYLEGFEDGKIVKAIDNSATIYFTPKRGGEKVTVEAWGFSGLYNEGGIPIASDVNQIYIGDPLPGTYNTNDYSETDSSNLRFTFFHFSIIVLLITVIVFIAIIKKFMKT